MDKTALGDRIKAYESREENTLMPRVPIVIRLDGRSFSKFCKGMKKPFDDDFREAMIEVTKHLVDQTDAKIGYTQSDEISLILYTDNHINGSTIFNGRVQKMCSVFASMASTKFLMEMIKRFPNKVDSDKYPQFDCRVFSVPNKVEAYNALLWREQDCTKNSISMVAETKFSSKELTGVSGEDRKKMLLTKGVNWDNFTPAQKWGVYVQKKSVPVTLSKEKLESIRVDKRPLNGVIIRSKLVVLDLPPIIQVPNMVDVIFDKEEALSYEDDLDVILCDNTQS
jgi:tRNA(His) 5'-end guanylyltransferase